MKLLNHTLSYLSIAFFLVIGIWAAFLYINMLDEIYDSIDDGLENSKILIIQKAARDSSMLRNNTFMENNYAVDEITAQHAARFRDIYIDSTLYMVSEKDHEPVRILKTAFKASNNKYYQLAVVSSMVEEDDLIEDLFYSILWLYVLLLVSILLTNNLLLRRIWKPFYQVVERLRGFKLESASSIPNVQTRISEFKMLDESVVALLKRVVATYDSQKEFIENASHELQTPLAVSLNKLELLAERESLSEADQQEITTVIGSLERLTRLNKTLLLLSRIENRQFPEMAGVSLNEVADNVISELSDLAAFKKVIISHEHNEVFSYTMNPELARIMVSNLLKNAIIHNVEDGNVSVSTTASSLTISNTGDARAFDSSQIFKRFYKGTNSGQSTGLGLAIVKSIVNHYGLSIQYHFAGRHFFTISTHHANFL